MDDEVREVGRRLLGEVEEGGLDELLHSLRELAAVEPAGFGIPPLDALIQSHTPSSKRKDRPPVIDVSSEHSGGGATHLVYLATAVAVLPNARQSRSPGGPKQGVTRKGGCAVVFDADGKFDVERLAQVIRHYIHRGPLRQNQDAVAKDIHESSADDEAVRIALLHVHIFRPQSLPSLVLTVGALPAYLLGFDQHHSGNRALELIVLESTTAFFWQEKMESEIAQWDRNSQQDDPETPRQNMNEYARLTDAMRHAQRQFQCPVIATSWGLSPVDGPQTHLHQGLGGNARPSFRPLLPPAWQGFVTLRLGMSRVRVKRFTRGMKLEEVKRDRDARRKAVKEGKFVCWVDFWGLEGVGSAVSTDGSALKEFELRIVEDGVEVN